MVVVVDVVVAGATEVVVVVVVGKTEVGAGDSEVSGAEEIVVEVVLVLLVVVVVSATGAAGSGTSASAAVAVVSDVADVAVVPAASAAVVADSPPLSLSSDEQADANSSRTAAVAAMAYFLGFIEEKSLSKLPKNSLTQPVHRLF